MRLHEPNEPRGELVLGSPGAADGLQLAVEAVRLQHAQPEGHSLRVVLHVTVKNESESPLEFDNNFGLLDQSDAFHRRDWVDPAVDPAAAPALTTLAPGESFEGDVHVPLPAWQTSGEQFRPAYSVAFVGAEDCCGGGSSVTFLPRAIWQSFEVEASDH